MHVEALLTRGDLLRGAPACAWLGLGLMHTPRARALGHALCVSLACPPLLRSKLWLPGSIPSRVQTTAPCSSPGQVTVTVAPGVIAKDLRSAIRATEEGASQREEATEVMAAFVDMAAEKLREQMLLSESRPERKLKLLLPAIATAEIDCVVQPTLIQEAKNLAKARKREQSLLAQEKTRRAHYEKARGAARP